VNSIGINKSLSGSPGIKLKPGGPDENISLPDMQSRY